MCLSGVDTYQVEACTWTNHDDTWEGNVKWEIDFSVISKGQQQVIVLREFNVHLSQRLMKKNYET